jgi:hypothetical protein
MKVRTMCFRFGLAACLGGAAGLALPFITPNQWWNLAYMPLYASWLTLPADLLFIFLCNVLGIDWLSDSGNKALASTMQAISSGFIGAIYGLAFYSFYAVLRRMVRKPG